MAMFMQMLALIRRTIHTASPGLLAGMVALWLVAADRQRSPERDTRLVRVEVPASPTRPSVLPPIPVELKCEMTDLPGGERSIVIVRRGTAPDRLP
jgi:hypothetical protein